MAGSLNINQIIPDQEQDLYLNTGQYGSNLVVGNATTKLVNISPSGNVSVVGSFTSNTANINSVTVNTSLKGPTPNIGDISANIATTQFVDTNATRPNITFITMNGYNTLFVLADGVLYSASGNAGTWGYHGIGRAGNNNSNSRYGIDGLTKVYLPTNSPIKKVGWGTYTCAFTLHEDGSLYVWGSNTYGQLGLGNTTLTYNPTLAATGVVDVYDTPTVHQFYIDYAKLFILKNDGYIYGAGYNGQGQLGINNTTATISTFTKILKTGGVSFNQNEIINFWNVGCNSGSSVLQTSDGRIWVSGYNGYGQFGLNNTTSYQVFTDTGTAWNNGDYSMRIKKVGGGFHSTNDGTAIYNQCSLHILMDNGTNTLFKTCGNNDYGQLGDGTNTQRQIPVTPNVGTGRIKDIATFSGAICSVHVLKENGDLWAFGNNGYGQLGDGTTTHRPTPTIVQTNVDKILHHGIAPYTYTYYSQAYIVLNNGQIKSTGYNAYGQLGVGDTTNRSSFTNVLLPTTGLKLFGYYTTSGTGNIAVFVMNDNTIYACGYNGQYGISSTNANHASVPVNFTISKAGRNY